MWTLLTGATGFIGQWLLKDLLARGHKVAVLIRPSSKETVLQRWYRIMAKLPIEKVPETTCLTGDLFNLAQVWGLACVDGISRVVHCAGDVSFKDDADCMRTNVDGLDSLLHMMRQAGINELHHVSTAYVCGNATGKVEERMLGNKAFSDVPNTFKTKYEQSKAIAEQLAIQNFGIYGNSLTVYRPAIVVGSSVDGYTTCYNGFYSLLNAAWKCHKIFHRGLIPPETELKVALDGDEFLNIIPVDYVSDVIARIVSNPKHHNKFYHIAPRPAISVAVAIEVMLHYFRLRGMVLPRVVFAGKGYVPNEVEAMLTGWLGPYGVYYGNDPYFSCTNLADATTTNRILNNCNVQTLIPKLLDYAIRTNFGKKKHEQYG